jgi:hypothetical protein
MNALGVRRVHVYRAVDEVGLDVYVCLGIGQSLLQPRDQFLWCFSHSILQTSQQNVTNKYSQVMPTIIRTRAPDLLTRCGQSRPWRQL